MKDKETVENPSQHEANKMLRVLSGTPRKYTVRVHIPDGSIIEFQTDKPPKLEFNSNARCLFICGGDYANDGPIMKWEDGMVILCEDNPKPE